MILAESVGVVNDDYAKIPYPDSPSELTDRVLFELIRHASIRT